MNAAGFDFFARSSPPRAAALRSFPSAGTSSSTTGMPADAASAAMPLPIVPAPTTPSFRIRIAPSLRRHRLDLRDSGGRKAAATGNDSPTIAATPTPIEARSSSPRWRSWHDVETERVTGSRVGFVPVAGRGRLGNPGRRSSPTGRRRPSMRMAPVLLARGWGQTRKRRSRGGRSPPASQRRTGYSFHGGSCLKCVVKFSGLR